jgi:hypothetical protein
MEELAPSQFYFGPWYRGTEPTHQILYPSTGPRKIYNNKQTSYCVVMTNILGLVVNLDFEYSQLRGPISNSRQHIATSSYLSTCYKCSTVSLVPWKHPKPSSWLCMTRTPLLKRRAYSRRSSKYLLRGCSFAVISQLPNPSILEHSSANSLPMAWLFETLLVVRML